jgi:4-hydroxy-4-methyl-2-oxoglutarate aldolase
VPVLARYKTPAQAIGRWRVTACQTPVRVRGALEEWVAVSPGDLVVADEDGVIVLPADTLDTSVTRVTEWSRSESSARSDIRNGMSLLQALGKYGHL